VSESLANPDFVFIDELVPGIRWDSKYATWDNFTGKPVDGYEVNRIAGTKVLAAALEAANDEAARRGFGLLLWDGYRPQRAVDAFLNWSTQPDDARIKARFHPGISRSDMFEQGYVALKSGHSRGCTVDLTMYHLSSLELADMGGDHDLMDPVSHHDATGVSAEATANRNQLRDIMAVADFRPFEYEWWHYTLNNEPYPDTYFDFPIA
jgi:D-alanyl-D-alanine dipeptidase